MATVFNWHVLDMGVENRMIDGHDDIVSIVNWECSGVQEDGTNTYAATLCRNTVIPYVAETWVPYSDLTESKVLGWVFDVDTVKADTETEIQNMLDLQKTPLIITPALPWAN